jgi:AcrR family transcriptional regulator
MTGRERIVKAATDLFERVGFESATMDEITEKAGVSKGLAYHHFSSKEELLSEIIELRLAEYERLIGAMKQEPSAARRLGILTDYMRTELEQDENKLRFMITTYVHPNGAKLIARAIRKDPMKAAGLLAEQARLLRDLGCPEPEAELPIFRATLQGIALLYLQNPEGYPLEDAIERFTLKYLHPGGIYVRNQRDLPS